MYNHIDKHGKTLMTASEKMQVITRTESHVVTDNLACHRTDIHFKKRYGSFMRTQIAKKALKQSSYKRTAPLSEALISGLCQYTKPWRKKTENWKTALTGGPLLYPELL